MEVRRKKYFFLLSPLSKSLLNSTCIFFPCCLISRHSKKQFMTNDKFFFDSLSFIWQTRKSIYRIAIFYWKHIGIIHTWKIIWWHKIANFVIIWRQNPIFLPDFFCHLFCTFIFCVMFWKVYLTPNNEFEIYSHWWQVYIRHSREVLLINKEPSRSLKAQVC